MRALPGLLVEYLINGVVAFFWLRKLYPAVPQTFEDGAALLLLPILYVAGMAVDLVAFALGYFPKHLLRRLVNWRKGYDAPTGEGTPRKVFIIKESPGLAEELEKRSSRDRIARGTVVNLIPLLYVLEAGVEVFAIAVLFAFAAWLFFESQSYSFEIQAADALGYREAILDHRRPPTLDQ